jgi:hypothetical protein
MALFWELVGNRICPTAISFVPTLSFWAEARDGELIAFILCPQNWVQMVKADPIMQLGGLVFNASKAKDYWNQKVPGLTDTDEDSMERCWSYEAEYLNYVSALKPSFAPNDYQKKVMDKYPNGLRSARPGVHYHSRPFPGEGPPFPVDVHGLSAKSARG